MTDSPIARGVDGALLMPCLYCRTPIPAESFAYWSGSDRLLSATCPDCERRVTLTAATWRSWGTRPDAACPTVTPELGYGE
jgi:hypothetical protein